MTDVPSQVVQLNVDPVVATDCGRAVGVLFTQIQQTVRMSSALAAADRTVNLTGLEDLVGILCAQALDLPPSEGKVLRISLEALLADCDVLASTLRHPSPQRQKAASCPSHLRPS